MKLTAGSGDAVTVHLRVVVLDAIVDLASSSTQDIQRHAAALRVSEQNQLAIRAALSVVCHLTLAMLCPRRSGWAPYAFTRPGAVRGIFNVLVVTRSIYSLADQADHVTLVTGRCGVGTSCDEDVVVGAIVRLQGQDLRICALADAIIRALLRRGEAGERYEQCCCRTE